MPDSTSNIFVDEQHTVAATATAAAAAKRKEDDVAVATQATVATAH
jgi:hypothetical protein